MFKAGWKTIPELECGSGDFSQSRIWCEKNMENMKNKNNRKWYDKLTIDALKGLQIERTEKTEEIAQSSWQIWLIIFEKHNGQEE